MGFTNAPGISFCWVGDDPIFLDLARDRYLALSRDAGQALRRITDGVAAAEGDDGHVGRLVDRDLLVETSGDDVPHACRSLPEATRSLIDADAAGAVTRRWSALADVMTARTSLAIFGLARTLERVRRRKRAVPTSTTVDDEGLGTQLARSFRDADATLGSLDLCVPRSVAMALRAARLGYRCDLVIGVKLRPFAAHCWVQRDHLLVNEQTDVARQFIPILVI